MESLRWILLVAGIIFILAIYLFGRQRRRNNNADLFEDKDELPIFSARDWDGIDEDLPEVHVIADETGSEDTDVDVKISSYDEPDLGLESHEFNDNQTQEVESLIKQRPIKESPLKQPDIENIEVRSVQEKKTSIDIIVLYVLAKPGEVLKGEKINSVAQANGFTFGHMNIFHHLDHDGQTLYSLANMMEPGNFDPETIHDMTTSGVTVFMQLSNLEKPMDNFDEMLSFAYHMSEMLGANLCNQNRQEFSQIDAVYYRDLISEKENQ